jgi:hypothetical protein
MVGKRIILEIKNPIFGKKNSKKRSICCGKEKLLECYPNLVFAGLTYPILINYLAVKC